MSKKSGRDSGSSTDEKLMRSGEFGFTSVMVWGFFGRNKQRWVQVQTKQKRSGWGTCSPTWT